MRLRKVKASAVGECPDECAKHYQKSRKHDLAGKKRSKGRKWHNLSDYNSGKMS